MKAKHLLQFDVLLKGVRPVRPEKKQCSALERLLAIGQPLPSFQGDVHAWLCHALGVTQQQDAPVAPYAARGDGLMVEQGYWLHADPVHLHLARDHLMLLDGALPDITEAEAGAMVASLNAHFPDMQFFTPHPQRWYVRLPESPGMITTPPEYALGRDASHTLPVGAEAKQWITRLNELQMLLHQHPANEARTEAGKLPVNSVWVWGGGVWQPTMPHPYTQVWGDGALLAGMAAASKLPQTADAVLAHASGRTLLVLDMAAIGWEPLETRWFQPLERALRQGALAEMTIYVAHGNNVSACTVRRSDVWKRWFMRWIRRTSLWDILRGND